MEAGIHSETSVYVYQSARRRSPQDLNFQALNAVPCDKQMRIIY